MDGEQLPQSVPHIPTELVLIVEEGFRCIYDCLNELARYVEDLRQNPTTSSMALESSMHKFKDFVEN